MEYIPDRFTDGVYNYTANPTPNGAWTFTRVKKTSHKGKVKKVTIPAAVMRDQEVEAVLQSIIDEGGFDY